MTASKAIFLFTRYLCIWEQSQSGDPFKEQVKVQIVLDLTRHCVSRNPSLVENIVKSKVYLTPEKHSSAWPAFHVLGTLNTSPQLGQIIQHKAFLRIRCWDLMWCIEHCRKSENSGCVGQSGCHCVRHSLPCCPTAPRPASWKRITLYMNRGEKDQQSEFESGFYWMCITFTPWLSRGPSILQKWLHPLIWIFFFFRECTRRLLSGTLRLTLFLSNPILSHPKLVQSKTLSTNSQCSFLVSPLPFAALHRDPLSQGSGVEIKETAQNDLQQQGGGKALPPHSWVIGALTHLPALSPKAPCTLLYWSTLHGLPSLTPQHMAPIRSLKCHDFA